VTNQCKLLSLLLAGVLSGFATVPTGPRVAVLPGSQKTFQQFQDDAAWCQQYAQQSIGGHQATQVANEAATANAVAGTAIGAAAGALIGSVSGNAGAGAAIGAGTGLLFGAASGTDAAYRSGYSAQQQYDGSYVQCMYSKGHQVPVRGGYRSLAASSGPSSYSAYPVAPPPPPGRAPLPAGSYPPVPPANSGPIDPGPPQVIQPGGTR